MLFITAHNSLHTNVGPCISNLARRKKRSILINFTFFSESKQDTNAEDPKSSNKLYKIKKPWNDCLVINKKKWKVQAARGNLYYLCQGLEPYRN